MAEHGCKRYDGKGLGRVGTQRGDVTLLFTRLNTPPYPLPYPLPPPPSPSLLPHPYPTTLTSPTPPSIKPTLQPHYP